MKVDKLKFFVDLGIMNVSIQVRGHSLQNKSHCGVYRHFQLYRDYQICLVWKT
jgi:hypothetical protein